jgi:tetratricopeptide (TPR) repeat protein
LRFPIRRFQAVVLVLSLASYSVVGTGWGQVTSAPEPTPQTSLDRARELLKLGEYDDAIELLKQSILEAQQSPSPLRQAYLLLIRTYVMRGNRYYLEEPGTAELYYQQAKRTIRECLSRSDLRHTQANPQEDPPQMVDLVNGVRGEIFGSFRVLELTPPDATITMDGDTLRAKPPEETIGAVDVAVGPHQIEIHRDGYPPLVEDITISPNSTLERVYELRKRRSRLVYAGLAGLAAAGVVAIGVLTGGTTEQPKATPLPDAPAPPDN